MQSSPVPLPVERALRRVGRSISLARRRRQLSQQDLADRIGASVNTVRRLEGGHPGTALQHFARALQVFGEIDKFEKLMESGEDSVGMALMDEKLPQRVRTPRRTREPSAF